MSRNMARQSNRNGRKKECVRNHVLPFVDFPVESVGLGCDVFGNKRVKAVGKERSGQLGTVSQENRPAEVDGKRSSGLVSFSAPRMAS